MNTRACHQILTALMMDASSPKKKRASRAKVRRREVQGTSLRRWLARARGKGLTGAALVFELRVRRGLSLREAAGVLGMRLWEVREFWRESCAERAALVPKPERVLPVRAPKSEGDVTALREQVCVALWETVVGTFAGPEASVVGESERAALVPAPMLSVRLRALRQMSKLYGVDCEGRAAEEAVPVNCATPEEIAKSVREWMGRRV